MMLRPLLTLSLATTLAACATTTPLPASTPALPGQWVLREAPGLPPAPEGVRLALRTGPAREGKAMLEVNGFAGVNHFRGQATLNDAQRQLVMAPLATTRMTGPAERQAFEAAYLQQLEQVGGYEWTSEGALVLRTLAGQTLTFARAAR